MMAPGMTSGARTHTVVETTDERRECAHHEAARQEQKAGGERIQLQNALHEEGQHDDGAEQGHHAHPHEQHGDREGAGAEGAQIEQGAVGLLQRDLPPDECGECHETHE